MAKAVRFFYFTRLSLGNIAFAAEYFHKEKTTAMSQPRLFTDAMWPPTMAQVKSYFAQKGISALEAEHFFLLYQCRGWRTRDGALIRRWKSAAGVWIKGVGCAHSFTHS